jgi:hypothetical protein
MFDVSISKFPPLLIPNICNYFYLVVTKLQAGRSWFVSRQGHEKDFSLRHRIQTGSAAYPASCSVLFSSSFPGVKRPELETNYLPPSNAEVKNAWSCTSTPLYVYTTWCLIKQEIRLYVVWDKFNSRCPQQLLQRSSYWATSWIKRVRGPIRCM